MLLPYSVYFAQHVVNGNEIYHNSWKLNKCIYAGAHIIKIFPYNLDFKEYTSKIDFFIHVKFQNNSLEFNHEFQT